MIVKRKPLINKMGSVLKANAFVGKISLGKMLFTYNLILHSNFFVS